MSLFDSTEKQVLEYVPNGMKGLNSLSTDERSEFEASLNPEQKTWSDEDKNNVYLNRLFVSKYGMQAFIQTPYEERMKVLNQVAIYNDAQQRFGNYSNWDEIKKLSETGLKRLLVSDYEDPMNSSVNVQKLAKEQEDEYINRRRKQISKIEDKWERNYEEKKFEEEEEPDLDVYQKVKRWGQTLWTGFQEKHNNEILASAKAYADRDILQNQEYQDNFLAINTAIKNDIDTGKIKQQDFDDAFEEFANSTYTTYDADGNKKEIPLFSEYTGRKDEKTFGIKTDLYALEEPEKRAIYSKYLALQETMIKPEMSEQEKGEAYGRIIDIINRQFQKTADEKETFLSNASRTYKGIATKFVSQFATEALGFYFLSLSKEEKAKFLAGLNAEGQELPWYFNMRYWNNVDMYNAWTPEEHEKIERNNGVSSSKLVVDPEEQGDWLTMENYGEAVAMTGYIAQSVVQDIALRGAGKLVKGAAMSTKLGKIGAMNRRIAQNEIVKGMSEFTSKAIRANMAAFPETMMEGVSIYDQTFKEIQSQFQDKLQNDKEYSQKLGEEINVRLQTSLQNATSTQQRIADAEGKTVGFQTLMSIPIYDITGKSMEPIEYASSEKEAYDIYKAMIYDREWQENKQQAMESATSAALATMAGFQLKNAVIGAVFEDFKFSKRLTPSGFDYRQLADGTFRINKKFVTHAIGSAAKQMVGGFIDESTDSFVEQFGSAYGLNDFNNYANKKYNTKAFTEGLDEISNLQAAVAGFGGAMADPEAYKEGFIGAMAPLNTHVNPVGMVQYARMSKEQRAALSTLEKMNQFIYNPLLQSITNDYRDYRAVQDEIKQVNDFVSKHKGDFEDILGVLAAHQRMHNADDANAAENAKDDAAFEFITMLNKLQNKNATQATAFIDELTRLANGEITNEDIASFFAYGDNAQLQQQKRTVAQDIAKEQLQQNAEGLLEKLEQYKKIENDFIVDFGDPYNNPNLKDIHDQVTYMQMQNFSYAKRIKKLREKLGLNSESTDNGVSIFTEEESKALTKGYERSLRNAEKAKAKKEKQLAALEEKLKQGRQQYKQTKDKKKKQSIDEKNQKIERQMDAYRTAITESDNYISQLNDRLKTLKENKVFSNKMINTDIFKSLDGKTLSYLLANERIAKQLKKIDPLYKEHIKDIAKMEDNIKNNEFSLNVIKNNPKAFSEQIMNFRLKQLMGLAQNHREKQLAKDLIEYKKKGIESLRKMSSVRVGAIADAVTSKDSKAIKNLAEAITVHEDAMAVLQDKYSQDQQSLTNWQETLRSIIGNANSKEEAYQALEQAINNSTFDENLQKQLQTLYKDLTGIEVTRNSTKPLSGEGKEKNKELKKEKDTSKSVKPEGEIKPEGENENVKPKEGEGRPQKEEGREEGKEGQQKPKQQRLFDDEGNLILDDAEDVPLNDEDKKPESVTSENVEKDKIKNETDITPIVTGQEQQPKEDDGKVKKQDSPTEMQGNAMYRYKTNNNGKMEERTPGKKGGAFEALLSWCKANNINYQSIIDNELSKFLTKKTPIYVMYANSAMEGAANMKNVPLLCVEFTDAIAKKMRAYDKGEKGGVFDFNGKRYLMIGNLGFSSANTEEAKAQGASYYNCRNLSLNKSLNHFKEHPDSRVFVDTSYSTRMVKMNTGGIVREIGKEGRKFRRLSELLNDASRNPRGLTFRDLNFMVSRLQNGALIIGNVNPSQVYALQQEEANNGNTFLLLQNANGMYVPIYFQPRFIQDEEFKNSESQLKKDIEDTIRKLADENYDNRLETIKQLSQMLVLSDIGLNILIGTEKVPTVSVVENEQVLAKFNLNSEGFEAQQLVDFVMNQCNFRLNVSAKALTDEYSLQQLDEAGALTTDIAYLGFMNASFTVAGIDEKGNMIAQETERPTQRKETNNRANSVMINKKVYRLEGKYWVDALGTPIIDQSLIDQCKLNHAIDNLGEHKVLMQGNTEFHVIQEQNNLVYKRNANGQIQIMSKEGAASIIASINSQLREKNAAELLKEKENEGKPTENKEEGDNNKPKQQKNEKKPSNSLINQQNGATFALEDILSGTSEEMANAFNSLSDVIIEKVESGEWTDFPLDNPNDYEAYLNNKGITTIGITNLQDWLKNIKECK